MNRKRKIYWLSGLLYLTSVLSTKAQDIRLEKGKVSYIAGQNIYVRFESTEGIQNGDTLFLKNDLVLKPALIVEHHSSISVLCRKINETEFKVGDLIFRKFKLAGSEELKVNPENNDEEINEQVLTSEKESIQKQDKQYKQDIYGRISATSYSNFSNTTSPDVQRFRYTFTMDAKHISDSKISAESYITFTHRLNDWKAVKEDFNQELKIYSLSVNYDFTPTMSLTFGRKINPQIANVGAIDGFQFAKSFNNIYVGAVVGSRPDYTNYSFNPDLLEYGAYVGQNKKVKNGFIQTSLAIFEQRNNGNTDRRFAYFQHSNTAVKNLNIFSTFEVDLYKLENGQPKSTFDIISFYFSMRYRFSKRFSLSGSYDNRKNVVYYETFKNYSDKVLQLASRQGLRIRANLRPVNKLVLGVNAGTRFRKSDPRPTNTVNGYVTYTRLPALNASLTVNANIMQTSYLDGQIYGARLSKDLLKGKLYSQLNYRFVNFNYLNSISKLNQHIGEIDFSYQFNKKLYLSVNFETTFQDQENYNRLYLNIRRKF